jgi:ribosomal protein S18 acetylase RimI-like enzyme
MPPGNSMWSGQMKKARHNRTSTVIRDYRENDYASLMELWQATGLAQPERKDDAGVIRRCNEMGGRLLVMEETATGRIIGSSWMTWDGRRIYLHHFGIHPDRQQRGLGTRLAEASLEWISSRRYQVKLEVHNQNMAAIRLYEKLGFFRFEDYDIYMIRDFD